MGNPMVLKPNRKTNPGKLEKLSGIVLSDSSVPVRWRVELVPLRALYSQESESAHVHQRSYGRATHSCLSLQIL